MNLIEQFGNSIWNFRAYHSFSRTRGSRSFLYIFLLFLLVYLISSIYNGAQLNHGIGLLQGNLAENVPDFSLSNGKFYLRVKCLSGLKKKALLL